MADEPVWDTRLPGFRACVLGPPDVLDELRALHPSAPGWLAPAELEVGINLHVQCDARRPGRYRIVRDGQKLATTDQRDRVLPYLEWALNGTAVERLADRYLFFHAGSVAFGGQGLILPAAPGSGKTTLVAGLVAAGFQYFSDEVAALVPATRQLVPFMKSLYVKRGSLRALARLYPELADGIPPLRFHNTTVWPVLPPPSAVPLQPAPVRYVVFPRYVPRAPTALVPVSRSDAYERMIKQSFNLRGQGAAGIAALMRLLNEADCYALTFGKLPQAVKLVRRLLANPGGSHGASQSPQP